MDELVVMLKELGVTDPVIEVFLERIEIDPYFYALTVGWVDSGELTVDDLAHTACILSEALTTMANHAAQISTMAPPITFPVVPSSVTETEEKEDLRAKVLRNLDTLLVAGFVTYADLNPEHLVQALINYSSELEKHSVEQLLPHVREWVPVVHTDTDYYH